MINFLKRIIEEANNISNRKFEVYKKGGENDLVTNLDLETEINDEIIYNNKKISFYKNKIDKLLDMYLNDMIDNNNYLLKKEEFEKCIKNYEIKNKEISSQSIIPIDLLKRKLKNLKQNIIDYLNSNNNYVSEEIVDMFVKNIVVKKDGFDWKLNYLNEILEENNNSYAENLVDNDTFFTRIIITKDDVDRFLNCHKEYRFLKLKEPIKVDVYL